ncbi:MAG: NFACT family protein, partial [Clostridia bacterium]|nr:NFACT family protein [Clostridia bacterium]
MGRYSNIILTAQGKILGGNRGINVFDNGVRPLFVGKEYVFPPVGDKKLPTDKSLIEYLKIPHQDTAEHLIKGVQGIALSTAVEIVGKFSPNHERVEPEKAQEFYKFLVDFLYGENLSPCVYVKDGNAFDVCVFPYSKIDGEKIGFTTLSDAENYYYKSLEATKKFSALKERLNGIISSLIKKNKKKISLLKAREKDADDCEKNRIIGELILANIYKLKQGDKKCELDNYYDGSKIVVNLDERLTPSKNADRYFKKYNKQKRTLVALEPQLYAVLTEQEYLNSLSDELSLAESVNELKLLLEELESAGYVKPNQTKNAKKNEEKCFRQYECEGFLIKVGRNNLENDKVTFTAKPDDVWVHVKDYHSSHVVVVSKGKEIPQKVLLVASEICAYYSKARNGGKAEVVYTKRKNVKKPSKSKPGFCYYENFKSITVEPNKRDEFLKTI